MTYVAMIGTHELLIILGILVLFFGSSKLPGVARGLGRSVTEFRKGLRGEGDEERGEESAGPELGPGPAPGQGPAPASGSGDETRAA